MCSVGVNAAYMSAGHAPRLQAGRGFSRTTLGEGLPSHLATSCSSRPNTGALEDSLAGAGYYRSAEPRAPPVRCLGEHLARDDCHDARPQ